MRFPGRRAGVSSTLFGSFGGGSRLIPADGGGLGDAENRRPRVSMKVLLCERATTSAESMVHNAGGQGVQRDSRQST